MLHALMDRLFPLRGELRAIKQQIKNSFVKVKEESEDHLQAINENTNEIQNNYEMICRLESKIDKLSERLDELYLLNGVNKPSLSASKYHNQEFEKLSKSELEVFMVLYTQNSSLCSSNLGRFLGIPSIMVESHIRSMIRKKIPVVCNMGEDGSLTYSLDEEFKDYQRKNNILGVDASVCQSLIL